MIDWNALPRRIRDKYSLSGETFRRSVKASKKDRIEIEIGDSKEATFKPQFKVMRWDNEVNFSMRAEEHPDATVETEGEVIKYVTPDYEVHQYEKPEAGEDGGFEFEWMLPRIPASNVLRATIQTKGLDFFYQPALTAEEIEAGEERPQNVVGSYAAFHSEKRDSRIGGKDYKSGKAFHIYRPSAKDANGVEAWCDLAIDEAVGELRVTVPQDFLDTAAYPVIVDPTFGYTSIGASSQATGLNQIYGSSHTSPNPVGDITSLSAYVNTSFGTAAYKAVITNSSRAIVTGGVGAVSATITTTPAWRDSAYSTAPTVVSATTYFLHAIFSTSATIRYDTGGGANTSNDQSFGNSYTSPSNPSGGTLGTKRYSIYATYITPETGTFTQEGYRFRNDDGSETSATWLAAQDTDTSKAKEENVRLRVLIDTTGDAPSRQFQLEQRKVGIGSFEKIYTGPPPEPIPTQVGAATSAGGTGDVTPALPTGWAEGDIFLLTVESANQPGATPSGYTAAYTARGTGTAGGTSSGSLEVFWKRATASESAPTVADRGDHTIAAMTAWRGCKASGTPLTLDIDSGTTSDTTISQILTTVANCKVLRIVTNHLWAATTNWVLITDGSLTNVASIYGFYGLGTASGNSGGTYMISGDAATAGYYGPFSLTFSNAPPIYLGNVAIALLPADPVERAIEMSVSSNIAASGANTTAQLTAPSGKTTGDFEAGRIQDDENPADTVNITADNYTEMEWNIAFTASAEDGETYEFRVTKAGTVLDTYSVTPELTVGGGATPVSVTKGLAYAVRKAISITKGLAYTVKAPTSITKGLAYAIRDTTAITAALAYSVKPSVAVTKALAYTVLTTPSAITKGLTYVVATPVQVTKGNAYAIITAISLNKALEYAVVIAQDAIEKALSYAVRPTTAVTKGLEYTVTTPASVTKGLVYAVKASPSITLGLSYQITAPAAPVTKGLEYRIVTVLAAITKGLAYAIKPTTAITKGAAYAVVTVPAAITKALTYAVRPSTNLTKGLAYSVIAPVAITKGNAYAVTYAPAAQTKALAYAIVTVPSALTKGMEYSIVAGVSEVTIPLGAGYTILTDNALTKGAAYQVTAPAPAIIRTLEYRVFMPNHLTKGLVYVVLTSPQIAKTASYAILTQGMVNKGISYVIQAQTAAQKALTYAILTIPAATQKALAYAVETVTGITKGNAYAVRVTASVQLDTEYRVKPSTSLTKSLAYTVLSPSAVTKGLSYQVLLGETIQKGAAYAVRLSTVLTKGLAYAVAQESVALTKALSYAVTAPNSLTKGLAYTVVQPEAITKGISYSISVASIVSIETSYEVSSPVAITKGLAYGVVTADTIALPAEYVVVLSGGITKSLAYVIAAPSVITKGLVYTVLADQAITKGAEYQIRRFPYSNDPTSPYQRKDSPYTGATTPYSSTTAPYTGRASGPYTKRRP